MAAGSAAAATAPREQRALTTKHEGQPIFHLFLHAAVPLAIAAIFFRDSWRRAFLVMMAGMLIDVDHLLANPIYDPDRCSIGFHPLHTFVPIIVYAAMLVHPKSRVVGIGLCIHIALDAIDCVL